MHFCSSTSRNCVFLFSFVWLAFKYYCVLTCWVVEAIGQRSTSFTTNGHLRFLAIRGARHHCACEYTFWAMVKEFYWYKRYLHVGFCTQLLQKAVKPRVLTILASTVNFTKSWEVRIDVQSAHRKNKIIFANPPYVLIVSQIFKWIHSK